MYNLTNWRDENQRQPLLISQRGGQDICRFVQDEIMILDNLTAYIGFRQNQGTYDGYINQVGTAGYPKDYASQRRIIFQSKGCARLKAPLRRRLLRTSIGKAFRPPTVNELTRHLYFQALLMPAILI